MLQLKVVNRYSIGKGTPEEMKSFNDFYDLEEARFAYENWIQRLYAHNHGEFEHTLYDYVTLQHP